MIEAEAVNYAYRRGEPVLNDISCKIEDGEFVALLGHNGSGKTTLSRLFMALVHPRSGCVRIDGDDIAKLEPADLADKVGYVFQNPDLQILEETVFDEVAYGPRCKKLLEGQVQKQVEQALAATGMTEFAQAYPRTLSFGQKRRLGVAVALALNPRILILDEITNGQDKLEKQKIMEYLQNINAQQNITIILITHDMDIARMYTQRSIVLNNGNKVFDGATQELYSGREDLQEWGLHLPVLARLSSEFQVQALSPAEFCRQITVKAGGTL